jgi:hypothetical protein
MTEDRAPGEREQPGIATKRKKVYQKPAFRYERVFETLALSCSKTGTLGQCSSSKKNS